MNKKLLVVIVIVLLLLCIVCSVCLGFTFIGMQAIFQQGENIKNAVLDDLCSAPTSMTESQYEEIFSSDFKQQYDYTLAMALMMEAFPSSYDCSSLLSGNLVEMISSGESVSINNINGVTSAQISFNNGNGVVTIDFVQSGEYWKISNITINNN